MIAFGENLVFVVVAGVLCRTCVKLWFWVNNCSFQSLRTFVTILYWVRFENCTWRFVDFRNPRHRTSSLSSYGTLVSVEILGEYVLPCSRLKYSLDWTFQKSKSFVLLRQLLSIRCDVFKLSRLCLENSFQLPRMYWTSIKLSSCHQCVINSTPMSS